MCRAGPQPRKLQQVGTPLPARVMSAHGHLAGPWAVLNRQSSYTASCAVGGCDWTLGARPKGTISSTGHCRDVCGVMQPSLKDQARPKCVYTYRTCPTGSSLPHLWEPSAPHGSLWGHRVI